MFSSIFKNIFPWIKAKIGQFGNGINNLTIANGVVSMTGTAKRSLKLKLNIDVISQIAAAKPTQVIRGINRGFSMPIYAADNEELFATSIVPRRWDGVSDLNVCIAGMLSGLEDIGDKFKFQLSWACVNCEKVMPDTTVDVETETIVLTGRAAAWNIYKINFTIDYDTAGHIITPGCLLSWRLRRIAASASEVTNEIVILVGVQLYDVDKMFGVGD